MQPRKRAAIYTRISSDPNGDALGVQRQEADARKLCEARGWTVAGVFCDNDASAYDRRKQRKCYNAMMEAVQRGEIDVVVAWHPDRLHRQSRELVRFIDLVNEHNVTVETVTAGAYDLSTPGGRMTAKILGDVAEHESEHKSARIRRKLESNAAEGKHHGGERPYGWLADQVTLDPAEAAGVREAAGLLLAGESCKSVARHLNEAGYRTSTGRPWRDVTVRDMLIRPRNAGLRVHHGEVVGQGRWELILTETEYRQAESMLTNPKRRTTPGRDGRVHLLSVIARCDVCKGPIVVAKSSPYKGRSKSVYRCRPGHVTRNQADVDNQICDLVIKRFSQPDAPNLLVEPDQADRAQVAAREVQDLRDRMNDAAEAYAAGVITLAQLTTINAAVRPTLEAAQADAASPSRERLIGDLVRADDVEKAWDATSPERRRAIVADLLEVTFLPRGKRSQVYDPNSIKVRWRA